MMPMIEIVYAVRAHMVDGAVVDLLLFAEQTQATEYASRIDPLPLGFDFVDIVQRRIIGGLVERRASKERPKRGLAHGPAYQS